MKKSIVALWLVVASLTACGRNSNSWAPEATVRIIEAQPPRPEQFFEKTLSFQQKKGRPIPLDILISLDNSSSLTRYMQLLTSELEAYAGELRSRGTDFRIGLVKSTENADQNHDLRLIGPHPIIASADPDGLKKLSENLVQLRRRSHVGEQEKAVESLVNGALLPANSGLYRSKNTKLLIAITDAEDEKLQPGESAALLRRIKTHFGNDPWLVIGLGSPREKKCPEAESLVTELLQNLVEQSGGKMGRICDTDYQAFLLSATESVFLPLLEFSLSSGIPSGARIISSSMRVYVDEREIPAASFRWDENKKLVVFTESSMPSLGQTVKVRFTYGL